MTEIVLKHYLKILYRSLKSNLATFHMTQNNIFYKRKRRNYLSNKQENLFFIRKINKKNSTEIQFLLNFYAIDQIALTEINEIRYNIFILNISIIVFNCYF